MKRRISLVITILLMVVVAGCTQGKAGYKDGTYDGKADKWEYGAEDATVVIEKNQIKSITLRRLTTEGAEVNYDDWAGQTKDGKTYPNLKQYRVDMAQKMLDKQTYDVDTITGATTSTKNWKISVQRALEKAKK